MSNQEIKWMSINSVRNDDPMQTVEERSPFLIAYGAIVHSSQFRRLSHKAQVRLNPSSDYVRTRLTHSIEAAQIGRQLARVFSSKLQDDKYSVNGKEHPSFKIDFEELTAAACLAHDIGHSPFGHVGEKKLNTLMEEKYDLEFEGNKQNIRLMLGSEFRDKFDVPYCLVDAIMKYKTQEKSSNKGPFYRDTKEENQINRILECTGLKKVRHPSCYLMEAADDISYLCGDIEDSVKYRIISEKKLKDLLINVTPFLDRDYKEKENSQEEWEKLIDEQFDKKPHKIVIPIMRALIKHCIKVIRDVGCPLTIKDIPDLPFVWDKKINNKQGAEGLNILYCNTQTSDYGQKAKELKEASQEIMLSSEIIAKGKYFAEKIITDLFEDFMTDLLKNEDELKKNPLFNMLPVHVKDGIQEYTNRETTIEKKKLARFVCDYISGMTDRYAIHFWERLNTPNSLRIAS